MTARAPSWIAAGTAFFLPWQTVWIVSIAPFPSGATGTYGVLGLFAVQLAMLVAVAVLRVQLPWRWLVAFLGLSGLSLLWSAAPVATIAWAWNVLCAVLLVALFSRVDQQFLWKGFALGLLVPLALGIFQIIVGESPASTLFGLAARDAERLGEAVVLMGDTGTRVLRAHGTFPHPNIFGGYLLVGVWCAAQCARTTQGRARGAWGALALVLAAGILLTGSRAALLGLCIGAVVAYAAHRGVRTTRLLAGSALVCIALWGVMMSAPTALSLRGVSLDLRSSHERIAQLADWRALIFSSPATLLLGTGPGAYPFALAHLTPDQPAWAYQPVHMTLLLTIAELGVIGTLLLFFVCKKQCALPIVHANIALLCAALPLLLFDHYLWSLWPGLALSGVILVCIISQNQLLTNCEKLKNIL